jgi:hypothetical protein
MTTTAHPAEGRPRDPTSVSAPPAPVAPPPPPVILAPEDDGGVSGTPSVAEPIGQYASDVNLLLSDARTAFILINHVRHRALERLFGISPDQANAVTVIGLVLLAETAHDKVGRFLKAQAAPTPGDGLFIAGAVRELLGTIAGPTVRDSAGVSTLVALALVGTGARPAAVKSLHALRSSSHRVSMGFHHRYGYLVDPGHWRQRRAQRATSKRVGSGGRDETSLAV